jgi:putative transposase
MPEDRQMAIELIDEACAAGARRSRACAVLGIDVRTLRRWRQQSREQQRLVDRRRQSAADRVPANKLSPEARERIVAVCNAPAYQSLPPSQIVPRLADEGEYLASESTFYRVLREADQQHRRGRAQVPRQVPKPRGFKAEAPNQVYSWDITYLAAAIRGTFYRLYLIEDIFSRKIVGWEVHEEEKAEHASVLIRKTCLAEGITEAGLVLHADNGGPMKGATMLATLQRLGVVPSFSRPSVSDDNPYSESLFRTLKYTPAYPNKPFESLSAAREWVHRFVQWYNEEHRHSAIRYVTPAQRHRGEDAAILAARKKLYEAAKQAHPERWSGDTRNWTPVKEVWLNPPKDLPSDSAETKKVT